MHFCRSKLFCVSNVLYSLLCVKLNQFENGVHELQSGDFSIRMYIHYISLTPHRTVDDTVFG